MEKAVQGSCCELPRHTLARAGLVSQAGPSPPALLSPSGFGPGPTSPLPSVGDDARICSCETDPPEAAAYLRLALGYRALDSVSLNLTVSIST